MPKIGEIKTGKQINSKTQRCRYIWLACSDCGLERWVTLNRSKKPKFTNLCRENGCQQKNRQKLVHDKDQMYWDGIKKLSVGMKISAVDLIRLGYQTSNQDRALLIWHKCPNCGIEYWRQFTRKRNNLLCELCSIKDNGKHTIEVWKDIEYKCKRVHNIMSSNSKNVSKKELFLNDILNESFKSLYSYVAQGKFIIGGKCPDFINIDRKLVILMHGDYWHLMRRRKIENNPGLTKLDVELRDIGHYAKYGYKTLIIWEHELKNKTDVILKIAKFSA